jgi:hypothetical protein
MTIGGVDPPERRAALHLSPISDVAFESNARRLAPEAGTAPELQSMLRGLYPQARVVESVVEGLRRWYVYRHGAWMPRVPG